MTDWWGKLIGVLVVGYLTMTRSFAYVGIAPLNLFIGDIVLVIFLCFHLPEVFDRWIDSLFRSSPLSGLALGLFAFLSYGLFEVSRGVSAGYHTFRILQNFVFHVYPLYLFVAFWVAHRNPGLLPRIIAKLAWFNGIYGVIYVVLLARFQQSMPGAPSVALFGQPAGSACAILGLLCIEPHIRRVWLPLLLNLLTLLAIQVRAEFVGALVGLLVWVIITGRFERAMAGIAAVAALLFLGYVTDFRAPGVRGEISTRAIIGHTVSSFDPSLAAEYSNDTRSTAGTVLWRKRWWRAIWVSVHETTRTALIGHGYGYPLSKLVPYINDEAVRTPHNIFYYALGYGGWLGVTVFFVFQLQIARLLWFAFRDDGQALGLVLWSLVLTMAFFGNVFETPFGAIPFYLLMGLSIAPLLRPQRYQEHATVPELLSAT